MSKNSDRPATVKDLEVLRSDLGAVRNDVGVLRNDLEAVRNDVGVLRNDLEAVRKELNVKTDRLASELVAVRSNMATKQDIRELRSDFERMYRTALDAVEKGRVHFEKTLSHGDILQDHEARLRFLETSR